MPVAKMEHSRFGIPKTWILVQTLSRNDAIEKERHGLAVLVL